MRFVPKFSSHTSVRSSPALVHTDVFLGMTCDKVVDFVSSIATKWDVPVVSVGSRGNELMLGRQKDPNSLKTVKE